MLLTERPGISIIIINTDQTKQLERLLKTFSINNTYTPVETIIVDQSSRGASCKALKRKFKNIPIVYIKQRKTSTFFAANNFAVKKARYPYLLFMDSNIIYKNDILPLAAAQLQDQDIGAVGVRLDDSEGLKPGIVPTVQHAGIKLAWNERQKLYQPYQLRLKSINEARLLDNGIYPAVTGAFLLCRRQDFEKVKGFYEDYTDLEDVDLCLRFKFNLKKSVLCINEISLQHPDGAVTKTGNHSCSARINNLVLFNRRNGNQLKQVISEGGNYNWLISNDNPQEALRHESDQAVLDDQGQGKMIGDYKVAVACHVFYLNQWEQIAEYIKKIPIDFTLFVSVTGENYFNVRELVLKEFPNAVMRVFPNRGKDIAPFIYLLREIIYQGFEIVCKIHTKRDHQDLGSAWRDFMLKYNLGSSDLVRLILSKFAEDPHLGMVGPSLLYKSSRALMYKNEQNIQHIWQKMYGRDAGLPFDWGFFAGSCFWTRVAPLAKLVE